MSEAWGQEELNRGGSTIARRSAIGPRLATFATIKLRTV